MVDRQHFDVGIANGEDDPAIQLVLSSLLEKQLVLVLAGEDEARRVSRKFRDRSTGVVDPYRDTVPAEASHDAEADEIAAQDDDTRSTPGRVESTTLCVHGVRP